MTGDGGMTARRQQRAESAPHPLDIPETLKMTKEQRAAGRAKPAPARKPLDWQTIGRLGSCEAVTIDGTALRCNAVGLDAERRYYAYHGSMLLGSEPDLDAAKALAVSGKRKPGETMQFQPTSASKPHDTSAPPLISKPKPNSAPLPTSKPRLDSAPQSHNNPDRTSEPSKPSKPSRTSAPSTSSKPKHNSDDVADRMAGMSRSELKAFAVLNDVWNDKYDALPNPGLVRMNCGNRLRAKIRKGHEIKWK